MCTNHVRPTFERSRSCIPNSSAMLNVDSFGEEFIHDGDDDVDDADDDVDDER